MFQLINPLSFINYRYTKGNNRFIFHNKPASEEASANRASSIGSKKPLQSRTQDIKDRFSARRHIAMAAVKPLSGKQAMLIALRQKVVESAKMNICNKYKLQDPEELAKRNLITDKCRWAFIYFTRKLL